MKRRMRLKTAAVLSCMALILSAIQPVFAEEAALLSDGTENSSEAGFEEPASEELLSESEGNQEEETLLLEETDLLPEENDEEAPALLPDTEPEEEELEVTEEATGETEESPDQKIAAPSSVFVLPFNNKGLKVTWGAVSGADRYVVYQSTSLNGTYTQIANIYGSKKSYIAGGLTLGKIYYFKVAAIVGGTTGPKSSAAFQQVLPAAPANINCKSMNYKSIKVTWTKSAGASTYEVYVGNSADGQFKLYETTPYGSSYLTNLVVNRQYYFKVRAVAATGNTPVKSEFSAVVHVSPKETPMAYKKAVVYSPNTIGLVWQKVNDAVSYDVYRSVSGGEFKFYTNTKVHYLTDKKLKYSTTYRYRIRIHYCVGGVYFPGGYSQTAVLKTDAAPAPVKYRAVLVGECNYGGGSSLPACEGDMMGMQRMLKSMKGNWTTWYQKDASKSKIFSMIEQACYGANSYDMLLFFYSGHGVTSYGASSGAMISAAREYIYLSELASALNKFPGKVIVMMDSCGSGAAINKGSGDDPAAFADSVINVFSSIDSASSKAEAGGELLTAEPKLGELTGSKYYVLVAASKYSESWTMSSTRSVFTNYLVTGTGSDFTTGKFTGSIPMDTNNDRAITLQEAYVYTRQKAYEHTRNYDPVQYAQVYPENCGLKMFFR